MVKCSIILGEKSTPRTSIHFSKGIVGSSSYWLWSVVTTRSSSTYSSSKNRLLMIFKGAIKIGRKKGEDCFPTAFSLIQPAAWGALYSSSSIVVSQGVVVVDETRYMCVVMPPARSERWPIKRERGGFNLLRAVSFFLSSLLLEPLSALWPSHIPAVINDMLTP